MSVPDSIRCARDRAHLAGAEALLLEKQAAALQARAAAARRRYFRELEAIDMLSGNTPSPFTQLGHGTC